MPLVEIYEDDDATLVVDLPIADEAGSYSTPVELHVWNDIGAVTGQTAGNAVILVETEDPGSPGTWRRSGLQPQDEQWSEVRIVGYTATGDPTWSVTNTDWVPLGAYLRALLGPIPYDCAVHIEYRERASLSAAATTHTRRLVVLYDEYAAPLPSGVTAGLRGVVHGIGDSGHTGILRGLAVTATGTPDDEVHVAAGQWDHKGILRGKVASDHSLNQTAADGALAAAQLYYATLSVGAAGVTVTKGNKGATPAKPAVPSGEKFLAWVQVDYQAGGTSVIETADITGTTIYDRYHLEPVASSLTAYLHAGQALGGGTWRYHTDRTLVAFDASVTSYVWQLATGLPEVTTTTTPPTGTALVPLYRVTTDGTEITEVVDLRTYAGQTVVLHLRGDLPGSPGTIDTLVVAHEHLVVERVLYRLSDNGGGSSGATQLDTTVTPLGGAAATLYTSHATEDHRPSWDFDATDLRNDDGIHEVSDLYRGDLLTLESLGHPTGGTPDWAEAYLLCRVP